jgi:hypothetical protein
MQRDSVTAQVNYTVQAQRKMHAKRWGGTDLEAENEKEDGDGEGELACLSILSYVSALSPLFSVGVCLLSFISAFSSLSLYWF